MLALICIEVKRNAFVISLHEQDNNTLVGS